MTDLKTIEILNQKLKVSFIEKEEETLYFQTNNALAQYKINEKQQVTRIVLYNTSTPFLPDELFDLEHLEKLVLINNQIEELHESVGKLNKLISLYLGFNRLNRLPEQIQALENLKEISLLYNLFDTFPEQLLTLPKLSRISLENNSITYAPELSEAAKSLEIVNLMNNHIEILKPESVQSIIPLKWRNNWKAGVFLAGNPIKTPPPWVVKRGSEAVHSYFQINPGLQKLSVWQAVKIYTGAKLAHFINRFIRRKHIH